VNTDHTTDIGAALNARLDALADEIAALKQTVSATPAAADRATITLQVTNDHMHAEITEWDHSGAAYRLHWTDFVANEWTEYFPDLPTALMRLAVLQRCTEISDGNGGFEHDARDFVTGAKYFLSREVYA
jgi:acyl carrier protein phosphodiesterase